MRPPAYLPGFEHDVFISYAQVDDVPQLSRQGWVSTFVELLTKRLAQLLGRPDCFSLWMDISRLDATVPVTPGIEETLKKTGIMIALLSNGYLESKWCPWEREVFLRSLTTSHNGPARIFVVELDRLEDEQRPKEFADYLRFKFWVQKQLDKHPRLLRPDDTTSVGEYLGLVDDLARELVEVLRRLRKQCEDGPSQLNSAPSTASILPKRIVYLAETTDDLDPARESVRRYLEQQNIEVVPRQYLPRDPDACRQLIDMSFAYAELYVQLLSEVSGRRLDGGETYVALQLRLAEEARPPILEGAPLPILQWREPRLTEQKLENLADATHRKLLEGPKVQAVDFEEFKQEILKTLERLEDERKREKDRRILREKAQTGRSNDKYIFVVADPKDKSIATTLYDFLGQQGFPCGLPVSLEDNNGITPTAIREDLENQVRLADGTVVVYGETPPTWYRTQLTEVRKLQLQCGREGKKCLIGLVVGPPSPKPPILIRLPGMLVIRAEQGIDDRTLQPFLDNLLECVTQTLPQE